MISVIVPVYNVEPFLRECCESILHQTYDNLEIILVDDGSTDGSGSICDSFGAEDARVVVIHKKNEGLVSARKTGLSFAHGDYVLNVDGDDWIDTNMCERLLTYALDKECDVVESSFREVRAGKKENIYTLEEGYFELNEDSQYYLLGKWLEKHFNSRIHSTLVSKLFRREVYEKIYTNVPNDKSFGEDMIAFINMLKLAGNIYVTPEQFYYYRIRESSISHDFTKDTFIKFNELDDYLYSQIRYLFPLIDAELMKDWYVNRKRLAFNLYDYSRIISRSSFSFPGICKLEGNIILYGAGNVGKDYYKQLRLYQRLNIIAWVDRLAKQFNNEYYEISDISKCITEKYDYILIAVESEKLSKEIKADLLSMGVDCGKIVWEKPIKQRVQIMTGDIES